MERVEVPWRMSIVVERDTGGGELKCRTGLSTVGQDERQTSEGVNCKRTIEERQ